MEPPLQIDCQHSVPLSRPCRVKSLAFTVSNNFKFKKRRKSTENIKIIMISCDGVFFHTRHVSLIEGIVSSRVIRNAKKRATI